MLVTGEGVLVDAIAKLRREVEEADRLLRGIPFVLGGIRHVFGRDDALFDSGGQRRLVDGGR